MALLTGKAAIVTGASSGIGRAIAERLAGDGAIVVVNYAKSHEKAQQVVAGIQAKNGRAMAIQADMTVVADVRRLVAETMKHFSRLDILVNNAGKFMPKLLADMTEAEFDHVFALQARGPYFAMQEAAKVIKDSGRIVNIRPPGPKGRFTERRRISAARPRWSSSRRVWHWSWLREALPSIPSHRELRIRGS